MNKFSHCGIMPNYECSAACRHCLYACSPERSGGYMTEKMMYEVCRTLKEGGCRSVHIGGGEPFLDFDGLLTLIQTAVRMGIAVDYVETNASWFTSEGDVIKKLTLLEKAGTDTLCISVDPYHAEYIPYSLPLKLAEACRKAGFGYFLWREQFLPMLKPLVADKAHDRQDFEKIIGSDYIIKTARAYGLRFGGRAVNIEAEFFPPKQKILNSDSCRGLLSFNHFHVDMYNRFIPPGCTGFVIPLGEVAGGIVPGRYPAFDVLLKEGIAGLLKLAGRHGFKPDEKGYTSGCALCFHIRRFLSKKDGFPELDAEFYEQSLRFYT